MTGITRVAPGKWGQHSIYSQLTITGEKIYGADEMTGSSKEIWSLEEGDRPLEN